jgi:hypothetical protein
MKHVLSEKNFPSSREIISIRKCNLLVDCFSPTWKLKATIDNYVTG